MKKSNDFLKMVVIMPCKNEADNLKVVVRKLQALKPVAIVIGLDPNTTDDTKEVALGLGCHVITAENGGYDPAVYAATRFVNSEGLGDSILYTDAGNKYAYDQVVRMQTLLLEGCDMVLAIRTDAAKSMLWHQKLGTKIVLSAINIATKSKVRDISPFRLVRSSLFDTIRMEPKTYRWPSELLVKTLASGLKVGEVDVVSLPRLGTSKVSGSFINSIRAGTEMFSSLKFVNYNKEHVYVQEKE